MSVEAEVAGLVGRDVGVEVVDPLPCGLVRAIDELTGLREVRGRHGERAQWRDHPEVDDRLELLHVADEALLDEQRQRVQRTRERFAITARQVAEAAQNCQFCHTGRMGLLASLSAAQIVQQAIEAPRARLTDGRAVLLESRVDAEVRTALRTRGHDLSDGPDWTMKVGGMQGVALKDGTYTGGCDPRRDGYCVPA